MGYCGKRICELDEWLRRGFLGEAIRRYWYLSKSDVKVTDLTKSIQVR